MWLFRFVLFILYNLNARPYYRNMCSTVLVCKKCHIKLRFLFYQWCRWKQLAQASPLSPRSNRISWTHKLTLWGRQTQICIGTFTIIRSVNGLSPGRRQAIIRSNAEMFVIGHLGRNLREIQLKFINCHSGKCIWKCLQSGCHFLSAWMCSRAIQIRFSLLSGWGGVV